MPMMLAFDKVSYTPGTLVSGHVIVIRSKSPQKVKGLSLRITGRVQGLSNDTGNGVKGKETYFDERMDIFGHDGRDSVVGVGETLFPFTFTLPRGLPSSFSWGRGSILYFVEAILIRSGWKDDKRSRAQLGVDGIYDLNLDPMTLIPGSGGGSKYVNHLLNKSGPFAFSVATQKSGFLKGSSIPFQVNIRNLSKVDAKRVKVSLIQEVIQEGKRVLEVVVEIVRGPGVPSGQIESWNGRLKIPGDIPPTNLGNLVTFPPIVGVNYFLQVELCPKSATMEPLSTKLPIIIGTIPLTSRPSRGRNHTHHEDSCPLRSHTPSPVDTPLIQIQSQFSPGLLIHPPPNRPQSHTHSSQGIYRRLRELQRRRRESPPPSYEEAVTVPEEGQSSNENEGQGQETSCQPQKSQPSPQAPSSGFSEEAQEVLPEVNCSDQAKVISEPEVSLSTGEGSPAPSKPTSQCSPVSISRTNKNHVVIVQIKGAGPEVTKEDEDVARIYQV